MEQDIRNYSFDGPELSKIVDLDDLPFVMLLTGGNGLIFEFEMPNGISNMDLGKKEQFFKLAPNEKLFSLISRGTGPSVLNGYQNRKLLIALNNILDDRCVRALLRIKM